MADTETAPLEPQARHIVYCGVCTLPPEYCEFGGTTKKCREWLEQNHPDMSERIYSADALEAATSTLSLDALKRATKDSAKKAAKAAQAEQKHASALAASRIIIKRVERNKRKYVTAVSGLEAFGLELKKRDEDGEWGEEIVVQGDVSTEIEDFLLEKYGDLVPGDNIELVEDKKKKGAGAAPGP
ncbi:Translation machinery-associated protein 22 [Pseudogymnoascus australis]